MSDLPTPAIVPDGGDAAFWAATRAGILVLPRCTECEQLLWYPRGFCPSCPDGSMDLVEASGEGTVYTFTVVRRGQGAFASATPYVIAYVELTEGPRILSNIVNCEASAITIGQAVRCVFGEVVGEGRLFRFEPMQPGPGT